MLTTFLTIPAFFSATMITAQVYPPVGLTKAARKLQVSNEDLSDIQKTIGDLNTNENKDKLKETIDGVNTKENQDELNAQVGGLDETIDEAQAKAKDASSASSMDSLHISTTTLLLCAMVTMA